jgi:hypothetical protein
VKCACCGKERRNVKTCTKVREQVCHSVQRDRWLHRDVNRWSFVPSCALRFYSMVLRRGVFLYARTSAHSLSARSADGRVATGNVCRGNVLCKVVTEG